jgi:hypothetical protein
MRLTLLIPELLWSEPGDSHAFSGSEHSVFAKILADYRRRRLVPAAPETVLLELLGLPATTALAPSRARADGLGDAPPFAGQCLCADPVHLRFHQERLILADGHQLSLSEAELAQFEDSLNAAFGKSENGRPAVHFVLRGLAGQRGYAWIDGQEAAAATPQLPLSQRIGREIRPSDLGEDPAFRRLANEVQMLLHTHPVNAARTAAGQATLNGLWLWGNGEPLPAESSLPRRFARLASNDPEPLIAGLAQALRLPLAVGLPAPLEGKLDTLLYVDTLSTPAHYQDSAAYAQAWRELDVSLFSPLLGRLKRGRLRELTIVSPTPHGTLYWTLTPLFTGLAAIKAAVHGGSLATLAQQLRAEQSKE